MKKTLKFNKKGCFVLSNPRSFSDFKLCFYPVQNFQISLIKLILNFKKMKVICNKVPQPRLDAVQKFPWLSVIRSTEHLNRFRKSNKMGTKRRKLSSQQSQAPLHVSLLFYKSERKQTLSSTVRNKRGPWLRNWLRVVKLSTMEAEILLQLSDVYFRVPDKWLPFWEMPSVEKLQASLRRRLGCSPAGILSVIFTNGPSTCQD